jgi:hypothetical protein
MPGNIAAFGGAWYDDDQRWERPRRVALLRTAADGILAFEKHLPGDGAGAVRNAIYKLGRLLQIIGLILLPVAIAGNLTPDQRLDLRSSLVLSGVGMLVFFLGWLLQQAGRPE